MGYITLYTYYGKNQTGRVQRKFLNCAASISNTVHPSHDYFPVMNRLSVWVP